MRDVMQGPIAAFKQVLAVVGKVKQVLDDVESAWRAQAEASALLGNVLKTTGANAWTTKEHLEEIAGALQKTTKYGDETIESMQTVLLGFRNITGKEFDIATESVLDMATVMRMDLTSAAQAVGKALDNPAQGLDSLSRQGFKFTDQEKALMKQMQDAGDMAGAQKIILDELAKTYGGAAKEAGNLAINLKDKLKNAVGDLKEELGRGTSEKLAPWREWLIITAQEAAKAAKNTNDYADAIKKVKMGVTLTTTEKLVVANNALAEAMEAVSLAEETGAGIANLPMLKAEAKARQLVVDILQEKVKAEERAREAAEAAAAAAKKESDKAAALAALEATRIAARLQSYGDWVSAVDRTVDATEALQAAEKENSFETLNAGATEYINTYLEGLPEIIIETETLTQKQRLQIEAIRAAESAYGDVFSALGEAFITGEEGWKGFANAGLDAISAILKALGAQLAAQAAGALVASIMGEVWKGMAIGPALAGSAAAYTAAGAISAMKMAEGGSGIVTKPTLFLAGEAGPEPYAFGGANNKLGMGNITIVQNVQGSIWRERDLQNLAVGAVATAGRGY
jgi:hypothetical protein